MLSFKEWLVIWKGYTMEYIEEHIDRLKNTYMKEYNFYEEEHEKELLLNIH